MDQKNIGQVSGVNGQEYQDFSGLNSLGAEQVSNGMMQEEAVARLNQMFESQRMPGSNGFDAKQMAMGQMAMQAQMNGMPGQAQMNDILDQVQMNSVPGQAQMNGVPEQIQMNSVLNEAQMNGVPDQVQMNGVLNQTQMNSVPGQAQMNSVPEEMRIGGVSEGMQTGGVPEWVQMNSVSGQGQFEQVNPMQIHSEQIQGFENANSQIEQEKNLETERAEVEQGEEFSDEGVPKSDLGKIVTVGTRTFEDGKLIGTDLPKARDRDGLEEEILKEVEKIKKIKSPTMQYRQERMLSANFIWDHYGRILGQEN